MTPDALHYTLLLTVWVALPALVLAAFVLHHRLRSFWSLSLLLGLVGVASGQALQFFSPIDTLPYEEFRGIVVSSGELPFAWHVGSIISAAGLLITTLGALGLAFTVPHSNPS